MRSPSHRPANPLTAFGLLLAIVVLVPTAADAKRPKDYSGELYNGVSIEEYCADLLSVEAFDLTEEDLATCDRRYNEDLDDLGDVDLGGIQLGGSSTSSDFDEDDEETSDPGQPKLSKKELEEQRLAAEEAEKTRLEGLGIVDFGEETSEEAVEGDDEEDEDLGDDFGDEDLDEGVDVFDDSGDTLIEDFDGGGGGSGLEDLDDEFGEVEDTSKKKKKKKKKKKGSSGSSGGFDDAMDIPDGLE
jgi:hypothetical protein